MIYLDYSANTPADSAVLESFSNACGYMGNPNSTHTAGYAASKKMNEVISSIAKMLNVRSNEVILTSGASESNNTAIKGIARYARHKGRHIISSVLEHPSVSGTLTALQEQGYEIDLVKINKNGIIDLGSLRELLRDDTILLTICAVDSELGTVAPIEQITEILKAYPNCHLHIDATQAIGKIPFDISRADTVTFTPHKFYGICGSGVLIKKSPLVIEPLIHGGQSTTPYRSGTPALALAAAAQTALKLAIEQQQARYEYVKNLNNILRKRLSEDRRVVINSPKEAVPHILNISIEGIKGVDVQKALDRYGVCVSVKSACSTPLLPSRAVFAISRSRKRALESWRISLSHLTTPEEIDEFIEILRKCCEELLYEQTT